MRTERIALAALAAGLAAASLAPRAADAQMERMRAMMRARNADASSDKTNGVKPYDEVIPEDAKTSKGLFITHIVKNKLYYEIPQDALGKDMVWVTQIEETQAGYSYAGMPVGDRVVRWEMRGDDTVLLRDVKYTIRADTDDPISIAVERTSLAPIIAAFPVKAWGKDKAPVIDVTSLFTTDHPEFSAARQLQAQGVDSKRTFIESSKAFPTNVETKALVTYRLGQQRPQQGRGFPRFPGQTRRDPTQSGVTVLLHHSMVKLPDKPMQPRRWDSRVGFFNVSFEDYADDSDDQVKQVRYITRWRLEKKDPDAAVSEPVKPIVWYVAPEVPERWKKWVINGIEQWQPAFEAAGFKNAIIGKLAPDPREDPDFDCEDARITCVRWLPSNIQNAFGPHVSDPRTGEILEADVRIYHNVIQLVRNWYFVQASPSDPDSQKLPLDDELMGKLLAFVVAHEVGHSLGFPHNMKASSSYTVEQLRDPEWTAKYGTAPSIMDYARFNYVAQPGDGAALLPKVGPYDYFAVEWGYRQFPPGADEKAELEKIVKRQVDNPMLRFGNPEPQVDPTRQTEDLTGETVKATELGLKNLDRVFGYLVEATSRPGEDYSLLQNVYNAALGQLAREVIHVANVVGGVKFENLYFGDAERRFFEMDAENQRDAVALLNENVFHIRPSAIADDILLRLEASGVADRVEQLQSRVLRTLLTDNRIKRMSEIAQRLGDKAYSPFELLEDLRTGIFEELENYPVHVDLFRRGAQRAFVDRLIDAVRTNEVESDLPALSRATLQTILDTIEDAKSRDMDETTRAHLQDLAVRIDQALKGVPPAPEKQQSRNPFAGR